MTISVDLSADAEAEPDLRPLPTAPGVFALEAGDGRTLALAITANLRRLVRARLSSPAESDRPTRRVDYRSLARRAIAMTVGSAP